jgi:hypothetical protein
MQKSMPFEVLLQVLNAFQTRPTDVCVATFPKSGTTWTQQIVHGLRTRGSMDFDEISVVIPFMEMAPMIGNDLNAPQVAEPRAFKTHLMWEQVPKGMRYIYVVREPGDVLVSFYHFMNGSLFEKDAIGMESFAHDIYMGGDMPWGTYWSHLLSWWPKLAGEDVLSLCFEDMKSDLEGTVRRIARFIGVEADADLIALATRQASFEFMSRFPEKFDEHVGQRAMEKAQGFPPGEPMSKVRTGQTGNRFRELSDATRAALDAIWKREIEPALGLPTYEHLRAHIASLNARR